MAKTIVLSGHGSWEMKDGYTTLPGKCNIKFYTCNMKTLSDVLGGDIDRGLVSTLEPDQVGGAYATVPNMRLYPPHGLHIRRPDQTTWNVVDIPGVVPTDSKNLQVRIDNHFGGGGDLKTLLELLQPAMIGHEVTILWAACRAIGLHHVSNNHSIGVNAMQR